MTDSDDRSRPEQQSGYDEVRQLVKSALRTDDEGGEVDVLGGVQKKLRERSQGKFYADRWSTEKQPPVLTYLVTSAIMLAILAVLYLVLAPLRGRPEPVDMKPAPVQVLPPPR